MLSFLGILQLSDFIYSAPDELLGVKTGKYCATTVQLVVLSWCQCVTTAGKHTHTQNVSNMHIVTAHNSALVHVFLFNETYLQHFDLFFGAQYKKV